MKRNHFTFVGVAATILGVLMIVTTALAGPRLICKSVDIGSAPSLPWSNPSTLEGLKDYDVSHLANDTLALLNSNARVLVRMETIRRATIYAQRDSAVAAELLSKFRQRAAASANDALAQFDYGYLAASYKQIAWARSLGMTVWGRGDWQNPAEGIDGYANVKKAIALSGHSGEMEFAAALITAENSPSAHSEHLRNALAGAKDDPLLAQNIATQFPKTYAAKN